jgi:tRNA-binding protein
MRRPDDPPAATITPDDFFAADIRLGTIVRAEAFPEARKPAFRLWIDFGGAIGEKRSSAQITGLYSLDDLPGRRVLAVVNFPPRQIGPVRSEVLVLGVTDSAGNVVLLEVPPHADVANGVGVS